MRVLAPSAPGVTVTSMLVTALRSWMLSIVTPSAVLPLTSTLLPQMSLRPELFASPKEIVNLVSSIGRTRYHSISLLPAMFILRSSLWYSSPLTVMTVSSATFTSSSKVRVTGMTCPG